MPQPDFDLLIIGAGPGGYIAAIRAAQLGLKTVLVEKDKNLGGACLNVGCIPSKALLSSTEHFHFAKERFAAHGLITGDLRFDLATLMKRKSDVVAKLAAGVTYLMKKNKVEVIKGLATLAGPHEVSIAEDGKTTRSVSAENILIATGSSPIELPFLKYDGQRVIHSEHAIALKEVPKRLLVIGAGAIGLELGSVWARLGSQVTIIEFLPRVAAIGFDSDTSRGLQRSMEKIGIKFELDTKIESAHVTDKLVELRGEKKEEQVEFEGETVLVAVGRKPYIEGLGLEAAGIQLTNRGRIAVDQNGQTNVRGIYAIGDVIEGPMLAHKAHEEGVAVAERIAGKPGHVNYDVIPSIIYTAPEAASVGLSEEDAKAKGIEVKIGTFPFSANGRAIASDMIEGFAKVIADAKTGKVLGIHLLAGNASEMIHEAVVHMEHGGTSDELARVIHSHPTMSEALQEAALAVENRSLNY